MWVILLYEATIPTNGIKINTQSVIILRQHCCNFAESAYGKRNEKKNKVRHESRYTIDVTVNVNRVDVNGVPGTVSIREH